MTREGMVKVRLGRPRKAVARGLSHNACLKLCPDITDNEHSAVLRLADEGMEIHLETGLPMQSVTSILDAAREGKPARGRSGG